MEGEHSDFAYASEEVLRTSIAQMQSQITQLQRALESQSSNTSQATPSSMTGGSPTRPKPILPNPPKFNGDRKKYEAWKVEMMAKIRTDSESIGTPATQFAYVNSRLEGAAQQMCLAYVQLTAWTADATAEGFFAYLDRSYADPNRKLRATDRLRTMKQGDSTFSSFLPRFERALADAGASQWADEARIAFLGGTLNESFRRAMVGHQMPNSYTDYVLRLIEVDGQLQTLKKHSPRTTRSQTENMEWEPSQTIQVALGKTRTALTPEERERCQKEGRCFYCREKGHRATECREKKDRTRTVKKISVTKTELREETESDTEKSESSSVSLN
jgi:hypothetical protein